MIKQEVIFNVKNLKISKTENIFATEGIKNVFTAVFQFHSTDWDGLAKTAVFENAEGTKEPKLLEEDRCDIPDSFFKTSGVCYVSVMAGDFMVTNKVAIIVVNAGYTSGDTVAEAKNYFEQILRYFDAIHPAEYAFSVETNKAGAQIHVAAILSADRIQFSDRLPTQKFTTFFSFLVMVTVASIMIAA